MSKSKGKGKQSAKPATAIPKPPSQPLQIPTAGSANPSASLSSLWGYIQPALDHIVRSPTNDSTKAPSINVDYHMGIHTAAYNYFTAQSETVNANPRGAQGDKPPPSGTDLYEQLDKYYAETARELLLGAPSDDTTLIHYIVPCFNRYSAGAQSVNRLLNYVNRHYVKRAVDEDKGWLRLNDVLESVAKTITPEDTREVISKRLKEKRTDELKKWGYEDGGSAEMLAQAEACAEAASAPDRVIPVSSLAFRRFRIEVIEPLLAVPKVKVKMKKLKHKIPQPVTGTGLPGPKGRLARAVKELLESSEVDKVERDRLAADLARILRTVGVRQDHPLRKRLDKFISTVT